LDHEILLIDYDSISIGQAVFTSSQQSTRRGYHLVARSPEVSESLARQLTRWGPAHDSLLTEDHEGSCLNFHSIDSEWLAVSRTLYGGPEYSRRGALQIVTLILTLRHEQLAGYENEPLTLARTAMLLGQLRLSGNITERLPSLCLPGQSPHAVEDRSNSDHAHETILRRAISLLDQGERIALVAEHSPTSILEAIFTAISPTERLQLSFTTGLRPSPDRRFRIHVLPFVNRSIQQQLTALGIRLIY
jgi:GTPase-associated protein 1, N-terminal domain type 2